ncbi:Enolase-phosphatase E1 [Yarrowia sp. C11]|nr:Enolase-phosphatase E1 [Yarrowia sp. E02]KAG5367441.1 Enolase-phosphatase E1 [Yarrowia sp. C11]
MATLLDIEGTVCSISFVHDILFPYALEKLPQLLQNEQFPIVPGASKASELTPYLESFPEEYRQSSQALEAHVKDLTEQNVKAPYLKALQGYIWKSGYESGEIKAPLYPDAVAYMKRVVDEGKKVFIYSSGSVPAQKLLFGYSSAGDLNPLISDYFDTINAGPKMEAESYVKILKAIGFEAGDVLFLSDNVREIEAAKKAGLRAYVAERPGNAELTAKEREENVVKTSFDGVEV